MAMVEMQMTLSLVVNMSTVSVGRGDWEYFRRQFIHRHFVYLGLFFVVYIAPPYCF